MNLKVGRPFRAGGCDLSGRDAEPAVLHRRGDREQGLQLGGYLSRAGIGVHLFHQSHATGQLGRGGRRM